jgi:signal transduction histidine kinase
MAHAEPNRMEMLGAATAGIVHDINNELTLVLNYLALLDLDGMTPGHVAGARDAAARCAALTTSLLSFSKGESLVLSRVDLGTFIRDFVGDLRLPPSVLLNVEVPDTPAEITGHPGSLRRILDNLISNACQAMKNAGTITLRAQGRSIWVQDSGPGIASGDLSRIFQPFFTTKGASGTGMGLAVVRESMQQQGGSAAVSSELGRGTVFELRFKAWRSPRQ